MTNPKLIEARTVLVAELNKLDVETSVRAAINYYREMYGDPQRVWVNPKDVPDNFNQIDGYKIERRGGCVRGKIMVL
jgi:hypothetical protein